MRYLCKIQNGFVAGLAACLVVSNVARGYAQTEMTNRFDVSGFYGWRYGGSVEQTVPNSTDRIGLSFKAAGSYGGIVDLNVYQTWEGHVLLEFYFSQQDTKIQARINNSPEIELGDLDVRYYHGGVGYQWNLNNRFSPYALFTLGATQYSSTTVQVQDSEPSTIPGETRFSWGFAGGVKYAITPRFGVRGDLRSFATGTDVADSAWACDVYGCDNFSFEQTLWQGDVTGGLYVSF